MKKYIIALMFIVIAVMACKAQDSYINGPKYSYAWGAATDTLVASDTITETIRVKSKVVLDANLALYVTKVSGTVTNNFFVQGSMTGIDGSWVELDTIALSNASTGLSTDAVRLQDFNYPYLRIQGISGATTQKAWYQLWYIFREE